MRIFLSSWGIYIRDTLAWFAGYASVFSEISKWQKLSNQFRRWMRDRDIINHVITKVASTLLILIFLWDHISDGDTLTLVRLIIRWCIYDKPIPAYKAAVEITNDVTALKPKYHFEEFFDTGCTGRCRSGEKLLERDISDSASLGTNKVGSRIARSDITCYCIQHCSD